jgi:hypothetical protein
MLMTRWEMTEEAAESLINGWLLHGVVEIDICDKKNKTKGMKVIGNLYY